MEVPVHVWRVGRNDESIYLLILQDEAGTPLWMTIGPCEAVAIWNAMRGEYGNAIAADPGSHDLLCDMISSLGGQLAKVVIDDFWNDVYFAKLHISVDSEMVTVDSRPSDAIAVALRLEAPLYVNDTVMEAVAHPTPQEESPSEEEEPPTQDSDLWGDMDDTEEPGESNPA